MKVKQNNCFITAHFVITPNGKNALMVMVHHVTFVDVVVMLFLTLGLRTVSCYFEACIGINFAGQIGIPKALTCNNCFSFLLTITGKLCEH